MKKRLVIIMILFGILSTSMLNFGQPVKYLSKDDGEIEWHSYNDGSCG